MHDTWAARDLPVLEATIGLLEQSYMVTVTDIAAKTALDPPVVAQALDALDPIYVDFRKTTTGGDPRFWYVFKVTPEARRAVGQWPTAEALASRLAEELAAAARSESNADNQALLAYAARLIGDTLRDATVRAARSVLTPAFGGVPTPEMGQQVPLPAPRQDIEFASLVPLPELPELLRPDQPGSPDQAAVAVQTEAVQPEAVQPEAVPAQVLGVNAQAGDAGEAGEAETTAPAEPPVTVPDLNPWPERLNAAEAPATALAGGPEPEPTPFRSSMAPWPAVDADADAADTDMDLVQARQERRS